jgi:hypothetical protein
MHLGLEWCVLELELLGGKRREGAEGGSRGGGGREGVEGKREKGGRERGVVVGCPLIIH